MYYIKGHNKSGETSTVYLDCEETYGIVCGNCGNEEEITGDEFYSYAEGFGVYESDWRCKACSDARNAALRDVLGKVQEVKEYAERHDLDLIMAEVFRAADEVRAVWLNAGHRP